MHRLCRRQVWGHYTGDTHARVGTLWHHGPVLTLVNGVLLKYSQIHLHLISSCSHNMKTELSDGTETVESPRPTTSQTFALSASLQTPCSENFKSQFPNPHLEKK